MAWTNVILVVTWDDQDGNPPAADRVRMGGELDELSGCTNVERWMILPMTWPKEA
jgi:hypothetical protein